jgi:hypothetical protein
MPSLRTLLVLGRTSNLPTVWSNCLAAWWLGGGGNSERLPLLLGGSTLLYVGGMFLNDAFDAGFDAQHRRERPIPSGAISSRAVWQFSALLLLAGLACLFLINNTTGLWGVALAGAIVLYDALHKLITFSPILMAACRFLLYLLAASTATLGITGWAVWCALALAAYIVGLSYLARKESTGLEVRYWPCIFLALPVLLAWLMNVEEFREKALLLAAVLGLWVMRCLRFTYRPIERNIGKSVAGLLAGIVWVDLLAVADVPKEFAAVFIGLFALALFFQRFVPAT